MVIPPFVAKVYKKLSPVFAKQNRSRHQFLKETCKRCRRSYVFISKLFSAPDAALPCLQALPPQNRCQTLEKISVIIFIIIITNCCAQVIVITEEVRYSQYNRACLFFYICQCSLKWFKRSERRGTSSSAPTFWVN